MGKVIIKTVLFTTYYVEVNFNGDARLHIDAVSTIMQPINISSFFFLDNRGVGFTDGYAWVQVSEK